MTDAEKLQHLQELEAYLHDEGQWEEKQAVHWARQVIEHNAEAVAAENRRCADIVKAERAAIGPTFGVAHEALWRAESAIRCTLSLAIERSEDE